MSVTTLIEDFKNWPKCVVEVTDITKVILDRGFVNSINFIPFEEDPRDILGMLVRWERRFLYGAVTEHCAVCYNTNVDPWFQRIVCAKEMVHILEGGNAQTNTGDGVNALLDSLFPGGGEKTILDVFRKQALHEYFAIYPATSILFPKAHRDRYAEKLAKDEMSLAEVAREYDLPEGVMETILSPEWEAGTAGAMPLF